MKYLIWKQYSKFVLSKQEFLDILKSNYIYLLEEIHLHPSSCTSNHHKGRFDSTKAVRQRIPKVTISSGSPASVSIYSIQVCPRTFVIPPGSLTCNGATSGGNIVIYIWGAELKAICIGSPLALNGVSYLVV